MVQMEVLLFLLPLQGGGWVGDGCFLLGQSDKNIQEQKLQRMLRRNMTDAERKLWSVLRGRQFDGYKFRRQHPYDSYILDFVCLERKLVIEVDGGQHADAEPADSNRTAYLEKAEFRVLRFWNHEALNHIEAVTARIWQMLHENTAPSPP